MVSSDRCSSVSCALPLEQSAVDGSAEERSVTATDEEPFSPFPFSPFLVRQRRSLPFRDGVSQPPPPPTREGSTSLWPSSSLDCELVASKLMAGGAFLCDPSLGVAVECAVDAEAVDTAATQAAAGADAAAGFAGARATTCVELSCFVAASLHV